MTYQDQDTEKPTPDGTEDFKTMLDDSMSNLNAQPKKGDVTSGKISSITESHIIISLGVKQDGYAEIGDYLENGKLPYKVGDDIKGFIVKMTDDQIVISKSLNRSHGNKLLVREAFEKQIPVKGKVIEVKKGGFSIDVFGVKGFCPLSHIDLFMNEAPENFLHNTYDFEIIEFDKGNVILSRKKLIAKTISEKKEQFFSKVKVGDIIKGTVIRITNFGAFMELGGYEGLMHISEVSWSHINKIHDIINIGDELDVKILAIDGEKISLSLKALQENPILHAIKQLKVGDDVKCIPLRHEKFGTFVSIVGDESQALPQGVEGLIPISLMGQQRARRTKPSSFSYPFQIGDEIVARIVKIDEQNHKISLSLQSDDLSNWEKNTADLVNGQELMGTIDNISKHGVFVKINDTVTGLMPQSKVKKAKLDITEENIGEQIEVRISNINAESHRISLEPTSLPALPEGGFSPYSPDGDKSRLPRGRRDGFRGKDNSSPSGSFSRDKRPRADRTKADKENTVDSDWTKYATNYQSVPEDNPFNKL
jgi:small subunit ribosomal protein S1